MQNPCATTSLKPGVRDVFIAKRISQMNNGHHRRKWKSPIWGVDELCFVMFCDVFFASIFFSVRGTKTFFRFWAGKFSSAAPNNVHVGASYKYKSTTPAAQTWHHFNLPKPSTSPLTHPQPKISTLKLPGISIVFSNSNN